MNLIELTQTSIYSVAVSLLLVYWSLLYRKSIFLSSLLFASLILLINFIPLYRGSSLVEILRGAVGDVSLASGGLVCGIILCRVNLIQYTGSILSYLEKILIVLIGAILYASTFGFMQFDVYHLGYINFNSLIGLSIITLILLVFKRPLGFVFLFCLISYYFKLMNSNNLWDYLIDPVLWLVLIVSLIIKLLFKPKNKLHY